MSPVGTTSGPPGVGLRVEGTGYPATCDTVYFFFDGVRIGASAPSGGRVSEDGLAVPGEARPGEHEVTSSCHSGGEPVMQSAAFEVVHADVHRVAPITALPEPGQVDFSLRSMLTSAAVVAGLLLLIAFPGELFNTTLEEHYDEVRGWFGLKPKQLGSETGRSQILPFFGFLVVGGLLYSLLNPAFRLDRSTVAAALGLAVAMGIVTLAFDLPSLAYIHRHHGDWGRLVILPGTLLVAAACVVLSRAVHFLPGYFYGLIAGITFRRQIAGAVKGRLVAFSALLVLALSVGSWLAMQPVSAAARKPGASLGLLVLEAVLGGVFWCGLDSLVIGLLPLRFLSGSEVREWSRRAWLVLFVLTQLAFVHILLRPGTGYVADTRHSPTAVVVTLFFAFAVFSVAFWGYFRLRDPRQEAEAEDWVEVG
ncbi:MAG TPA: FGLLP motif-containing membrane protein [Acidimicrobiales bacterium]|nr:FGLLP motif-containing membrane protein [Acidimicrobiales bacterium]